MKFFFITLLLIFFLFNNSFGKNKSRNFLNIKKSHCDSYEIIDGQRFCLKVTSITLNSCGKKTDWPCLEESGCLKIKNFVLDVH